MFSPLLGFRLTLLFMGLIKPEECTGLNPSEKQVLFELIGAGRAVGSSRNIIQSQAAQFKNMIVKKIIKIPSLFNSPLVNFHAYLFSASSRSNLFFQHETDVFS